MTKRFNLDRRGCKNLQSGKGLHYHGWGPNAGSMNDHRVPLGVTRHSPWLDARWRYGWRWKNPRCHQIKFNHPPPGASQSTYTSAYRLYIMCMGMVVVVWFRSLTCCLFDYPTKSVLIDHTTTLIRLWCGSKAKHACTLLSSFNIVSSFRFSIFFFSKR